MEARRVDDDKMIDPPAAVPTANDAERLAFLRTVAVLRRSVKGRRPVSLPTLLRYYRRQLAAGMISSASADTRIVEWLGREYRAHQPFDPDKWMDWRRLQTEFPGAPARPVSHLAR